jgi:hypothetical protein
MRFQHEAQIANTGMPKEENTFGAGSMMWSRKGMWASGRRTG